MMARSHTLSTSVLQPKPLTPAFGIQLFGASGAACMLADPDISQSILKHGVVILRGFEARPEEFESLTTRVTPSFMVHVGLGRDFISEDKTTQSVAKGMDYIPAHIERGYAPPVPRFVFFYCARPADVGGETTVYDGYEVFAALDAATRQYVSSTKLRWLLRLAPEVWTDAFLTTDKSVALSRLHRQVVGLGKNDPGTEIKASFDGIILVMDFLTPATFRNGRRPGEALANSALSYLLRRQGHEHTVDLRTSGGAAYPEDILAEIQERSEKVVVPITWNKGDIACIDNRTVMHGRYAFQDPLRSIYIRLGMQPPPDGFWNRLANAFKVIAG